MGIRWLLVPLVLTACAQPQVPVARVWSSAISQYALQPIFPIREGVQPGDVFVIADYEPGNRASQFRPRSLWVARLPNLNAELARVANSQLLAPATTAGSTTVPPASPTPQNITMWPQPTHQSGVTLASGSAAGLQRFGLAAMPEVEASTTFTAGAAAGAPLLGPLRAALGLTDERRVTVRPVGVEMIGLPFDAVRRMQSAGCAADANLGTTVKEAATHIEPGLAAELDSHRRQVAQRVNARVMVPAFVFYLRGIDFSFGSDTALVSEVAAVREEWQRRSESGTLGNTPAPVAPGVSPPPADVEGQALATALAQRLVGRQIEGLVPASASFSFVSGEGVVLRQIFQQPLAFAASGPAYGLVDANGGWASFCSMPPVAAGGAGDPAPLVVTPPTGRAQQ